MLGEPPKMGSVQDAGVGELVTPAQYERKNKAVVIDIRDAGNHHPVRIECLMQQSNKLPGIPQVLQDIEGQDRIEWTGIRDNPEYERFVLEVAAVRSIDSANGLIGDLVSKYDETCAPRHLQRFARRPNSAADIKDAPKMHRQGWEDIRADEIVVIRDSSWGRRCLCFRLFNSARRHSSLSLGASHHEEAENITVLASAYHSHDHARGSLRDDRSAYLTCAQGTNSEHVMGIKFEFK